MEIAKPTTYTPLKSTNVKTEPLFLELFNRAAVDLDQKGKIEVQKYKKFLILVVNIGPKVASIKLFEMNMMDSQLLYFMTSNLWDLETQLYRSWIEVTGALKDYIANAV